MSQIKKQRRVWLKVLCGILIIMFVFTIVSRITASFTVAQVYSDTPTSRKIQHPVTTEGTIEKNREQAVVTQPDVLTEEIMVNIGDSVSKGDILVKLAMDSIKKLIADTKSEILTLTLQNDDLINKMSEGKKEQQSSIKRANEDYRQSVSRNKTAVKLAKNEYEVAKKLLQKELKKINDKDEQSTDNLEINRAQEDYDAVVLRNKIAVQKASTALTEAKNALAREQSNGNTDLKTFTSDVVDKQDAYDTAIATESSEVKAAARALEDAKLTARKNEKTAKDTNDETIKTLKAAVSEKKQAYNTALETQESETTTAKRALEDAKEEIAEDSTIEVNRIAKEQLEDKLEGLMELGRSKGKITASDSGTITAVNIGVGEKTTDTAILTMTKDEDGYAFVAQVGKDDKKYLEQGDTVTLSSGSKKEENVAITSITSIDGENVMIRAEVAANTFPIGARVTMSATKDSEEYNCTVPISSLYQEKNKNYVLVLDTEQTVLGETQIARKTEVKVLDKNSSFAALEDNSLAEDCQVITETDRYVEAGARVRLIEE